MPKKTPDFEKNLAELEKMVELLEKDELTLKAKTDAFVQGMKLTEQCQKALEDAKQTVKTLTESSKDSDLKDFE